MRASSSRTGSVSLLGPCESPGRPEAKPRAKPAGRERDSLPTFDDWVVEKAVEPLQVALPAVDQPGYVRAKYLEKLHVPHGTITGVLPVVYGRDIEGHWHIVSGADPESREPDSNMAFTLSEINSLAITKPDLKTLAVDAALESVDPGNPSTHLTTASVVLIRLPTKDGKVPAEPEALFGIP